MHEVFGVAKEHVDDTRTLITRCSGHADAARSLGACPVLVDASDTAPDVAARIVTQLVTSRKVLVYFYFKMPTHSIECSRYSSPPEELSQPTAGPTTVVAVGHNFWVLEVCLFGI